MKRFSDFANEQTALEGDKVRLDDVINREIQVMGYRVTRSRFSANKSGNYLTIQFCFLGNGSQPCVVFTGSEVLMDQLERYAHEIPFVAVIKKINRYYTLT